MKRGVFSNMNPTLRGLLLIAAVAAVIVALRLQLTLVTLLWIAQIAFLVAIAFFVYTLWRQRRSEIGEWSTRARVVFYGAAALAIVDLAVNWWAGAHGLQVLAFIAVLAICAFAMWRTWRDQHTYV